MENNQFIQEINKAIEAEKSLKRWLAQSPPEPLKASEPLSEALKIVHNNTDEKTYATADLFKSCLSLV